MPKPQLKTPCLALITDRSLCHAGALSTKVAQAVSGGVGIVHLREKDLPAAELLVLAREVKSAIAGRALFIVNTDLDAALAVGADGIHLPENGLPIAEARNLVGSDLLIGRSMHSLEAALQAEADGADYLFIGTIFPSRSHPNGPVTGVALLREVARRVAVPCFGIGGIDAANVREVMVSGAAGVAVISAILAAPDSQRAARELVEAMQTTTAVRGGERR